jgi:ABC-2 type transport system permease protein
MFARRAAPQTASADRTTTPVTDPAPVTDIPVAEKSFVVWYLARIQAFCIAELQKIRHDRSEMITRAVQPALWLVIFGQTVSRLHAVPTGDLTYEQFLAPGVLAQSGLFVAVFYGIQVIWERDAGVLAKVLSTPTPRGAFVTAKAFSASVRVFGQAIVVMVLCVILGIDLIWNPLNLFGAACALVLGAGFFTTLSMTIAGVVLSRERLMGVGQMITMPLFFASNALYPVAAMPTWVRVFSRTNPLTYEVNALRGLLLGTPATLWLDFTVLVGSLVIGIVVSAKLLPRLVR